MAQRHQYFLYDNNQNLFLPIADGMVCGRSDGPLCFPKDDLVSKAQFKFFIRGNEIHLEVLSTTNRTRINSVDTRPRIRRRLRLNDVIEFGAQRLILTNQDRQLPQNTQDSPRKKRVYKGLRKSDGSITACHTGIMTPQTKVAINPGAFRILQLKKAFREPKTPWLVVLMFIGVMAATCYSVFTLR